jgi:antitoxin component YwqK of YwqJK toxin-antitoxin module
MNLLNNHYTSFNNGVRESFKTYYENGKLKNETTYKNGVKDKSINYDESGNEIK